MSMSMDEALSLLLAKVCAGCGTELAYAGSPCQACGSVPPVTEPELRETLSGPGKLAQVEADRVLAHARQHQERAGKLLAERDRILYMAALAQRADDAEAALAGATAAAGRAAMVLRDACGAERGPAAALEEARTAFTSAERAEEAARRMREGPEREIETAQRLEIARGVLARYQGAHDTAKAVTERARQDLRAAQEAVAAAQAQRDQAVAILAMDPRPPMSRERIFGDLIRVVLSGDTTPVEDAMVRVIVTMLATITGAEASIRLDAAKTAREEAEAARAHGTLVVPTGNGTATVVTPSGPAMQMGRTQ